MSQLLTIICCLCLLPTFVQCSIGHGKYDFQYLPNDLRPVTGLVGKWESYSVSGGGTDNFPFGKIVDFGIDPVPMFGARALNYTATTFSPGAGIWSNTSRITHQEYGFMTVRNKTRNNPQVLLAFLTTAMEGYSIVELGLVDDNSVRLDMNKFVFRSFQVNMNGNFQIFELHREWRMNGGSLEQSVKATTSLGHADYVVSYQKLS